MPDYFPVFWIFWIKKTVHASTMETVPSSHVRMYQLLNIAAIANVVSTNRGISAGFVLSHGPTYLKVKANV